MRAWPAISKFQLIYFLFLFHYNVCTFHFPLFHTQAMNEMVIKIRKVSIKQTTLKNNLLNMNKSYTQQIILSRLHLDILSVPHFKDTQTNQRTLVIVQVLFACMKCQILNFPSEAKITCYFISLNMIAQLSSKYYENIM